MNLIKSHFSSKFPQILMFLTIAPLDPKLHTYSLDVGNFPYRDALLHCTSNLHSVYIVLVTA